MSLCWAARGGEALELSNPLSGELGITSAATCLPACLPGAKITDTHIHTYKEYAHRYSQSNQYMHREKDSRHIGDFFGSYLVGLYPENHNPKSQSRPHWTKLTHACFDQKIISMAFSPKKCEKRSKYTETAA